MPIMKNLKQVSKISISGFIASTFPSAFLALNAFATGNMFSGGVQGGADKGRGEGVPTQLFGEGNTGIFTQMINMMLFAVGILSVVMLSMAVFAIFSQTEIRKKLMLQKIPSFTQLLA